MGVKEGLTGRWGANPGVAPGAGISAPRAHDPFLLWEANDPFLLWEHLLQEKLSDHCSLGLKSVTDRLWQFPAYSYFLSCVLHVTGSRIMEYSWEPQRLFT